MPPLAGPNPVTAKPRPRGWRGRVLTPGAILDRAVDGARLADAEALALADCTDLAVLMRVAASLRDRGHGDLVS